MNIFEIPKMADRLAGHERVYDEFLRVPAMSAGLYHLAAEAIDPQQPHTEDELYYVIAGRGRFRCGEEDRDVRPGHLIFVPARAEHRFHSITEDLTLLVVFAPAESGGNAASREA